MRETVYRVAWTKVQFTSFLQVGHGGNSAPLLWAICSWPQLGA